MRIVTLAAIAAIAGGLGWMSDLPSLAATEVGAPVSVSAPAPFPTIPPADKAVEELRTQVAELRRKIDKPPKDTWDKIAAISGLASGVAVALIGFYATNVYNQRQKVTESKRADQQVRIAEAQALEKFLPHLASGSDQMKSAALIAISVLGNDELAVRLAAAFRGPGATSALTTIATTLGTEGSASAKQALIDVLQYLEARVVTVHEKRGLEQRRAAGFILDAHGLVVTTAHAVSDISSNELAIGLPNDLVVPAALVRVDLTLDLALLQVQTTDILTSLDITPSNPEPGATVTALLIGPRAERRIQFGSVVGLQTTELEVTPQEVREQRRRIVLDLDVQPGASGSPVVDKEGHFLGIIQATDLQRRVLLISAQDIAAFATTGNGKH